MAAWMQGRHGPNRVGPQGLLQPLADLGKFIFKEDMIPGHVNRWMYLLAPSISLIPALVTFAVMPYTGEVATVDGAGGCSRSGLRSRSPTSTSGSSTSSRSRASASTASRSAAGPQLEVLPARRRSVQRADDLLRALAGAGGRDGRRSSRARRRSPACTSVEIVSYQAETALARLPAAARVLHLPRRVLRRDEPPAVRPPRGRDGARRRLPHRVLGHEVRAVLPRRVHRHDRRRGAPHDAVLRRLDPLRAREGSAGSPGS